MPTARKYVEGAPLFEEVSVCDEYVDYRAIS
jgi:hypothetical protein